MYYKSLRQPVKGCTGQFVAMGLTALKEVVLKLKALGLSVCQMINIDHSGFLQT